MKNFSKKKILFIFGTRPEAIKMASVILKFRKHSEIFDTYICTTGQHKELLEQVMNVFNLKSDYNLSIMQLTQDLYDVFGRVLIGMRSILDEVLPDYIFVHGDTSTSTASALAAFYKKMPVCHIEAGLRTNNIYSPWPEEMNRQITTRISTFHFAPTEQAKMNLIRENIDSGAIFVTGNTVIDSLKLALNIINDNNELESSIIKEIKEQGYNLDSLNKRKIVLITGHRRENFGEGFENICNAIKSSADNNPNVDYVYPVHFNPNVRKAVNHILKNNSNKNIFLIEPIDYFSFVYLMNKSYIILTDSGGIQEEAPFLNKPVLLMRDTTERPEAVDVGTVKLVGTKKSIIEENLQKLIDDFNFYLTFSSKTNPYGDGNAAERIFEYMNFIIDKNRV